MLLNNRAREFLEKHKTGLEKSYGVKDASKYFALTDPKEISLRAALLDEVDFLNMITCIDVDQLSGQVISVGNPGIFTGIECAAEFAVFNHGQCMCHKRHLKAVFRDVFLNHIAHQRPAGDQFQTGKVGKKVTHRQHSWQQSVDNKSGYSAVFRAGCK